MEKDVDARYGEMAALSRTITDRYRAKRLYLPDGREAVAALTLDMRATRTVSDL